ncbi:restriction endonuclease subunit S [Streptomyces sp. NRRL F-5065]|uniref:restriction endonuclease subunit S n=1 Tax=Streptomyces sp. NRRL F-5065 TaxID=1463855 RepID=UPI00068A6FB6|nr:restriction endonuclease subunit S [Streptomyces sp. NRRL F-5065]
MTGPLWKVLPDGWRVGQVKNAATVTLGKMLQSKDSGSDVCAPYMRAANVQPDGVLALDDVNVMWFTKGEMDQLSIRAGDVVVVEGGQGGFGRAAYVDQDLPGWGFQNSINRLRAIGDFDGRFIAFYLIALRASGFIRAYSNVVSMPHLTAEKLARIPIPLPPVEAQRAIANYLDRETARIDTLIEEQQRLIGMLRERRFALRVNVALHGTVLTEEVPSPLPWVESLPAGWRVVPLTSVAKLESGHTPSRSREDWWRDCYIPWVSLHDVGGMRGAKYLHDTTQHISDAGIANSSARLLPARTVVLSRDATVGRTAIMGVPMATSQHFAAWVCGPDLDPEYLWVLFEDAMQPFFDSFQNGSTIRTIGMGDLKAFRIPLPPLDEQRRIVEYLDEETAKIDSLIAETERFVELSKERRSALITAAVTGQIDVREAA